LCGCSDSKRDCTTSPRVHEPDLLAGLLDRLAGLTRDGHGDEVGNARTGSASSQEDELLLRDRLARERHSSQETGKYDGGRALDVVVKRAVRVLVLAQQREGRRVAKVLELQQHVVAVLGLGGVHELVHELLELLATDALLAQTDVEGVGQVLLVVGAAVEHDRQAHLGRHTGARRVQRQLADGDAHAVGALVAQAEDALAVGEANGADVLLRPVVQDLGDVADVVNGDVQAARRLTIDVAELLARLADRGRVHDGHELHRVLREHAVVHVLVGVLHVLQEDVLLDGRRLAAQLQHGALGLELHGGDGHRQQAAQLEGRAFLLGEGLALVGHGGAHESEARLRHRVVLDVVDCNCFGRGGAGRPLVGELLLGRGRSAGDVRDRGAGGRLIPAEGGVADGGDHRGWLERGDATRIGK
jgi:hypothetical protein